MGRQCAGRLLIDVGVLELVGQKQDHQDHCRRRKACGHGAPGGASDPPPFRIAGARSLKIGVARERADYKAEKDQNLSDDAGHENLFYVRIDANRNGGRNKQGRMYTLSLI